jgi:hypothetical protein
MMKQSSPNVATIALAGLMLLALAAVFVLATNHKKAEPAPEGDEIVFKPEVVETDEGNATLMLAYDGSTLGSRAQGTEEIPLAITYNLDNIVEFNVQGFLKSTQRIDIGALDQGRDCWFNILHNVEYNVVGTFNSETCKFVLYIGMTPTSSKLLSTDCSFDPGLPINKLYMAPHADPVIFTSPLPSPNASAPEYSFSLADVALPSDVNCPAFGP